MATIRKRKQKYQVQVRKNGYQTISKTFSSLSVARSWAKVIEADIERQIYICPQEKETVGSLIERYEKEVVRNQRSAESTVYLLRTLNNHLGQFFIQDLSAKQLGKYRDLRLKDISPASLKREMGVLRGMINHATREWEINLQQNPISMVSLPKVGNGRDRRLEAGEEGKLLACSGELKKSSSWHWKQGCAGERF